MLNRGILINDPKGFSSYLRANTIFFTKIFSKWNGIIETWNLKPESSAIFSIDKFVVSKSSQLNLILSVFSQSTKVIPVAFLKCRVNVLRVICVRSARLSILCCKAKFFLKKSSKRLICASLLDSAIGYSSQRINFGFLALFNYKILIITYHWNSTLVITTIT